LRFCSDNLINVSTTISFNLRELLWRNTIGLLIQRKIDGYPSSPTDGTQVYFGTGNSFTDTGLITSTTYYYRAWSYYNEINAYSPGFSQDNETTQQSVNQPPVHRSPTPTNDSINQPLSFTFSIHMCDPEGNPFTWTIQCINGQTKTRTGQTGGTYSMTLVGLTAAKTYKVWVNATDPAPGSGLYTRRWYTYTT
jgi:hypothetical protein